MIKYKRRTINQKPELHDKEFVVYEDVEKIVTLLIKMSIKFGADKKKIEEFFNESPSVR